MNSLRNCISLVLILTIAPSTLFFNELTVAASKPFTPQVTIKFVNATYPLPTTDPYTGQTSTILGGNYSIEVTIKNQDTSDSNNQIFYNIRVKPHFDNNSWAELYGVLYYISENNGDGTFDYAYFINDYAPAQSTGSFTTISLPLEVTTEYGKTGLYYRIPTYYNYTTLIPEGGQVDFQVQALTGYFTQRWVSRSPFTTTVGGYYEEAVAFDVASDWSNTQTITIGETSSTSPTPNPTPTVPELSWLAIVPLLLFVLAVAVIVRHQKTASSSKQL
jgi:hypothetical protein